METTTALKAVDPMTGAELRDATESEVVAYHAGNAGKHSAFRGPVRVGDVLVDEAWQPSPPRPFCSWDWV
jgi:hypothetical protein